MSSFRTKLVRYRIYLDLEAKPALIIAIIFLFTSFMDIITQVFLPEIIKLAGIEVTNLPEASMTSVFQNVWGDFLTTGTLIVIYYGSTAFSSDINNDKPIYFYLSHPITKKSYYYDRAVVKMVVVFSICILASLVTFFVSSLMFDPVSLSRVIGGAFVISFCLVSILSVMLLFNSRFSTSATIGIGLIIFILMSIIQYLTGYITWFEWFSPLALSRIWSDILVKGKFDRIIINSIGFAIWTSITTFLGIRFFDSRDV